MHWFLILTISSPWGVSIESVGPFVNQKNCTRAANIWEMDRVKRGSDDKYFSAICVQR